MVSSLYNDVDVSVGIAIQIKFSMALSYFVDTLYFFCVRVCVCVQFNDGLRKMDIFQVDSSIIDTISLLRTHK